MWEIYEHQSLVRKLSKIPAEVLKRYEKWKDIVVISGPEGLRMIKGFRDESLKGQWKGFRSSRLGKQYRLIYKIENKKLYVKVIDITPHDYRRK
jgi:addiction module RelE/StbE family toxin